MLPVQRQRVKSIKKWAYRPLVHNAFDIHFLLELVEEQDALLERAADLVRDLAVYGRPDLSARLNTEPAEVSKAS